MEYIKTVKASEEDQSEGKERQLAGTDVAFPQLSRGGAPAAMRAVKRSSDHALPQL